jgi:translation initiation factor 1 (eIF-1/SUI1)
MYAIEEVPGKGKGLIATKDIPAGARIVSEEPMIDSGRQVTSMDQLQTLIVHKFDCLREDQQRDFLSMHNVYPYNNLVQRYCGIFRSNALPFGPGINAAGIFLHACRINHACDNNAVNFWSERLNHITIQAVRDIEKGEEITISYLQSFENRQARQEQLQDNFKFTCACGLCSLPPDQSKVIDSNLDRIHEIDGFIAEGGVEGLVLDPQQMLSYVDEQARIWSGMQPNAVGLARAYPDAFELAIANGDLARARTFAERLVPLYLITLGDDSADAIQYSNLVKDPTKSQYYGMSMKWRTAWDDVPRGLESKQFEDWLWRRIAEHA